MSSGTTEERLALLRRTGQKVERFLEGPDGIPSLDLLSVDWIEFCVPSRSGEWEMVVLHVAGERVPCLGMTTRESYHELVARWKLVKEAYRL